MSDKSRPDDWLAVPTQLSTEVRALVRLAARIAAADESGIRVGCQDAVDAQLPVRWVEECILQSYLFAGFPRALNAMREWRRISGVSAPSPETVEAPSPERWRDQGEATCAIVYGKFYDKLRVNIAGLHPALDEWMILEGYGKVLSRPGMDLMLRELCIVAACVASGQDRQLHSHLHGALNAGASADQVNDCLAALEGVVSDDNLQRSRLLFARVVGKA